MRIVDHPIRNSHFPVPTSRAVRCLVDVSTTPRSRKVAKNDRMQNHLAHSGLLVTCEDLSRDYQRKKCWTQIWISASCLLCSEKAHWHVLEVPTAHLPHRYIVYQYRELCIFCCRTYYTFSHHCVVSHHGAQPTMAVSCWYTHGLAMGERHPESSSSIFPINP